MSHWGPADKNCMRVLLFRSLCDSGGVSTSMLLLGRQLMLRGIECEYWFCKPSNRLPEFMETGRATLAPLSKLAARLKRGDFDVVHMTASDDHAPLVSRMAERARVIVTARGALAEGWNHSNCFAYTAISNGMADVNQPYTDLKIEVVRNAIDVDRFAPRSSLSEDASSPIVAFVGRTTANEKDFPRFTRIARRLMDRGARVWVADPHQGSWDKFEREPVERIEIERWERVPHSEIADFYRSVAASDGVVIVTSRTEGFGNVAPEAAACGARVAAPDVMGLREAVIDGVTGRLYPADASDDDVAEMIGTWMAAPHDMAACAHVARTSFSPERLADAYVQIYSRAEQRLLSPVPQPTAFPERSLLLAHLARQKVWRAQAASGAALDFASEGYPDLAISALVSVFRTAPAQFVSRAGSRRLVSTLRRLAGRSGVLARQLGKRR